MGKMYDNMSSMIMEAMKSGDKNRAQAYKNLKTRFMEFKTARNAKPLDDDAEMNIIKKTVKSLNDTANTFETAGRNDLAESYKTEAGYIQVFLPKEASEKEIRAVVEENISADMTIKDIGKLIKIVKESFESVDGKMVSDIVKSYLTR